MIRRLRFRQSGGFAGLLRGCDVAGEDLDAAHRRALEAHLQEGRGGAAAPGARDQLGFELELDTDAGPRRLVFDELAVPPALAPLVAWLQERSRPTAP